MCQFEYCVWETEIPALVWERMKRKGIELDLNKGGLWDTRSGCINLWASPEDHPDDPDWHRVEIRRRALEYPRSYVAGFFGEYIEAQKIEDAEDRALAQSLGLAGLWTGDLTPEYLGGMVKVHLGVAPYEKAEVIVGRHFFGETAIKEGGRYKKVTAHSFVSQADIDWCVRKFEELKETVLKEIGR